jgi:hypothetical protein
VGCVEEWMCEGGIVRYTCMCVWETCNLQLGMYVCVCVRETYNLQLGMYACVCMRDL